ncbi:tetratricopeptide repeat protein [Roseovarius tibetensis]|uniref:tetratricopeptide repeat protein n=1 Tax=Roseovarius tibetensis TaxID=2685897 RepID=UPI003D7F4EEA
MSALALAALLQAVPMPAVAQDPSGPYLAARQARVTGDFAAAARYYSQVLTLDPSNPEMLENATVAYIALGQIDRATAIAGKMASDDLRSQVAQITLIAEETRTEDWTALIERMQDARGAGELADGLITAWAHLGRGDVTEALAGFDAVAEERGLRSFALFQKALALASVGDFEGADQVFSGDADGPVQQTRRGVMAWAQVLSQLDEQDRALDLIDETFGSDPDPQVAALRARIASNDTVPFDLIRNPRDGVAEVFFSLAQALRQDANDELVLLYARIAEAIRPDHTDAILTVAELLENMGQYDLAIAAYKKVPRDHPSYHAAELGRAEVLRRDGRPDAAIEVVDQLVQAYPDLADVHVAAGDLYRSQEQYADAVASYDRAITLLDARDNPQWFVFYARAISHERQDNWERAEADFRRALDLNPGHPQVLNYLGYSMVEEGINLDEALDMIERAVAERPESGYIVDSLGWALYRLGRYDEAIVHMERAAELMPTDPVVNDHLGDVLWAVDRKAEARFQWKRALSLHESDPSPDLDPDRVRRKLDVGLDEVLEAEGAAPLKAVDATSSDR